MGEVMMGVVGKQSAEAYPNGVLLSPLTVKKSTSQVNTVNTVNTAYSVHRTVYSIVSRISIPVSV